MSTSEKISLKKDLESGVPRCIEELLGDQADEKEVKLITTTNQVRIGPVHCSFNCRKWC